MTVHDPQYQQPKVYPARADRQLLADIFNPGVIGAPDLKITATGNANEVAYARGVAYVFGNMNADQGNYRFFEDTGDVIALPAPVTFPRVDLIVARIYDAFEQSGDALGDHHGAVERVAGVETSGATTSNLSGAPTDASLPKNVLKLAYVLTPVGSAPIPAGNVVDFRPMAGLRSASTIPIGVPVPYCFGTPPSDGFWDWSDGGLIDRRVFAAFYAGAGHTFNGGVDPGNNMVRKPDIRGRVPVGLDNFGSAQGAAGRLAGTSSRGTTGGEQLHVLTAAELAAHIHNFTTGSEDHSLDHAHFESAWIPGSSVVSSWEGIQFGDGSGFGTGAGMPGLSQDVHSVNVTSTVSSGLAAHHHAGATDSGGGNAAHNNMQPFINLPWIVRIA